MFPFFSFISTLVTYVLTHHLGWVTTVSPYDAIDKEECSSKKLDIRRPYNALRAQLTDLCGSIGYPPRSARTIITGSKNQQFITRLLSVLTYFVRCGDVSKNDYKYEECLLNERKIVNLNNQQNSDAARTVKLEVNECSVKRSLKVPSLSKSSGVSVSTLVASDISLKKSMTLVDLNQKLSSSDFAMDGSSCGNSQVKPLRRHPTMMTSLKESSDSSPNLSASEEWETKKVVFVLGDDDKLVGLKNKSSGKQTAKKSAKPQDEVESQVDDKTPEKAEICKSDCDKDKSSRNTESPSKCCGQTLQHSKPIKHSGFKFEFDKYPQIVTNYMKSKNLEILDRHYIGKPGNLKLDNYQFDPTLVPQIQEERCETCYKCQLMESMLQTPTNASEMEYRNDIPRQSEPQYAKETVVDEFQSHREMSPKTFVRKVKDNTVIVNPEKPDGPISRVSEVKGEREENKPVVNKLKVRQVIEFPLRQVSSKLETQRLSGYEASLLGGLTSHYVPDLVLQGE